MKIRDRSRLPLRWLLRLLFTVQLSTILLSALASARDAAPRISKTAFKHKLHGLFYFEDTDIILAFDQEARVVHRSTNAGEEWAAVDEIPEGEVADIWQHPYDKNRAYVLSAGHKHWYTNDQGETWHSFDTGASPSWSRLPLSFHAGDSDKIIFQGKACTSIFDCDEVGVLKALYTKDGFKTDAKMLRSGTRGCNFARSSELFSAGTEFANEDRILCIVRGRYSPWRKDYRLVITDTYFTDEYEPDLEPGRAVKGLVSMAVVKKYIVAAVKAAGTDEMALYVTDDTKIWHRAQFPNDHKLTESAYTMLESTNYSIQVDVMNSKPSSAMGVLFTSNSNGTYFTRNVEHTNRNNEGHVDFENIQGIQGIVLVNVVDNWKEVEKHSSTDKKKRSQISFDGGRTFQNLKLANKDLHLHSVTDIRNTGRVFSTAAPGIVLGVGNTGDHLKPYDDCDLFVSDDAGLTWRKARDGGHKYEVGDQGSIIVAIKDVGPTSEVAYSINHGKDWDTVDLGDEVSVTLLTTTPDSTVLKFIMLAEKKKKNGREYFTFSLDFGGLHERKCGKDDFEKWWARLDEKEKPDCLMGHKQYYMRRKADADCFIGEAFKDPEPEFEICDCTDEDYECDYNFVKEGNDCVPAGPVLVPDGACKNGDQTFMGSSGYRLIPGNVCKSENGPQKEKAIERKCQGSVKAPANGKITSQIKEFKASKIEELFYLERTETSTGDDETVVLRTDKKEVFISHDHGKNWKQILKDDDIVAVHPHTYFRDVVFFITEYKTVHYSMDRGKKLHQFEAPLEPTTEHGLQTLQFHPEKKDWLIWTGARDCKNPKDEDCHSNAHLTTDRGDNWQTMLRYVQKCQFIALEDSKRSEKLIYCEQFEDEDKSKGLQLVTSDDFYVSQQKPLKNIVAFATMEEFIVVAAKDEDRDQSLKVEASLDGTTFARALFPANFKVPYQRAYTVLDSSTHAVFLHATVNDREGYEFGTILKSNSNGTSYVLSIEGVNRNIPGYVDFEKVQGLEGVAIVNVVDNIDGAQKGEDKQLKTMITHNDGAEWALLPPPEKDAEEKAFECSGPSDTCALHLHGYTERNDPSNTFSSPSAVGLMMGVGNVGEHLKSIREADTFMTRDGGITWEAVKKGRYMWEYGDQGSIIVLVQHLEPTDVILYSLDEGRSWKEYQFSDKKMRVDQISTVPSDNSMKFLLRAKYQGDDKKVAVVNLDFSGLRDRQCKLDENNPEDGDYYLWQPKHPLQKDDCLFGHVAQYHRKKPEADCYNGRQIERLHSIGKNCPCTRQDFECDFNYQRQNDGSCGLVPGFTPPDHSLICKENDTVSTWYEPTGYRRIPLTTCEGGRELAYIEEKAHACPNHEEEFERKHGRLGSFPLFLVIVLALSGASAVGYWVWRHWDGKFGRIKLGEPGSGAGGSGASMVWDAERPWIKYPVMVIAVVVAVVISLPDTTRRVWRSVGARFGLVGGSGRRFTSRSSFARGRGDYDVVDPDEGELLGEDSDEEV